MNIGSDPEVLDFEEEEAAEEDYIDSDDLSSDSDCMEISKYYSETTAENNLHKYDKWAIFDQYKPYRLYSVDAFQDDNGVLVACGGSKDHSLVWNFKTNSQVAKIEGESYIPFPN